MVGHYPHTPRLLRPLSSQATAGPSAQGSLSEACISQARVQMRLCFPASNYHPPYVKYDTVFELMTSALALKKEKQPPTPSPLGCDRLSWNRQGGQQFLCFPSVLSSFPFFQPDFSPRLSHSRDSPPPGSPSPPPGPRGTGSQGGHPAHSGHSERAVSHRMDFPRAVGQASGNSQAVRHQGPCAEMGPTNPRGQWQNKYRSQQPGCGWRQATALGGGGGGTGVWCLEPDGTEAKG